MSGPGIVAAEGMSSLHRHIRHRLIHDRNGSSASPQDHESRLQCCSSPVLPAAHSGLLEQGTRTRADRQHVIERMLLIQLADMWRAELTSDSNGGEMTTMVNTWFSRVTLEIVGEGQCRELAARL